jgi:hypothetical protein
MELQSELDVVVTAVSDTLALFLDSIKTGIKQLRDEQKNSGLIKKAYHVNNPELLTEALEDNDDIRKMLSHLNTRQNKGIAVPWGEVEAELQSKAVVPLMNLLLNELPFEINPCEFKFKISDEGAFMFLYSQEPIDKLDDIEKIFLSMINKLKEIVASLRNDSQWQLDDNPIRYFHSGISPSILYCVVTIYASLSLNQEEGLYEGVEWVRDENVLKAAYFSGRTINKLLCDHFGVKNLYIPVFKDDVADKLVILENTLADIETRMDESNENITDLNTMIKILERSSSILKELPSTRMYRQFNKIYRASLVYQVEMLELQNKQAISAEEALQLKRILENVINDIETVPLCDVYDNRISITILTLIEMNRLEILYLSDEEIVGIQDDVKRRDAICKKGFHLEFTISLYTKLLAVTQRYIDLKKLSTLDEMWEIFSNDVGIFLSTLKDTSSFDINDDYKLILQNLLILMVNMLHISHGLSPRPWQTKILFLLLNNLIPMGPLSKNDYRESVTLFIAKLSPTSQDFEKACQMLNTEIVSCFQIEIEQNNRVSLIKSAAFALSYLHNNTSTEKTYLVNAINFLLKKLNSCLDHENHKKNTRDFLMALRSQLLTPDTPKPIAEPKVKKAHK